MSPRAGDIVHVTREASVQFLKPIMFLTNVQDVFFQVDVDRGRVLAMAQRRQVPRTVAFDLANGARVWEFEGWAEVLDDLIIVDSPDGGKETVYDAHTLAERWSVSGMVAHFVDPDARSLVAMDKEGRIAEYELATGAVIRSARVDLPRALNYGLGVMGDSIVIFYENVAADEAKMLILDRRSLQPRASTSDINSHTERYDCGPVLCEVGFDAGQVSVLDKAGGEKLWETRHGTGVMATPAGMFAYPLFEGNSSPPLELLEPRTGRRIASLEGWQPIVRRDRFNRAAPVVLRQVHTTGSEGQTFIAGFDRLGLRVLGSLPYVIYNCLYVDWVLACVTGDRHLLVVEINSGRWQA